MADKQERTYYRQLYIKVEPGEIYAFIPGTIMEIFVKKGQKVKKGEPLFSLHAMKMDNVLCSTIDGTIKAINIKKGQIVTKNDVLVEIVNEIKEVKETKEKDIKEPKEDKKALKEKEKEEKKKK
jgi:pyruvate carboxylase subunit B